MTILKLVSSVLRLLTAYFERKNRSLYFDLLRDSEKTQDGLIQEIEYLREKGTEEATLTADFLRKRLHGKTCMKKSFLTILMATMALASCKQSSLIFIH